MKSELVGIRVEDRDAEHVRGQEVAGELNARVVQSERAGQRLRQGRLADAWNVLDQQMAARQHAGERKSERRLLAHHDAAELGQHGRQSVGQRDGKRSRQDERS